MNTKCQKPDQLELLQTEPGARGRARGGVAWQRGQERGHWAEPRGGDNQGSRPEFAVLLAGLEVGGDLETGPGVNLGAPPNLRRISNPQDAGGPGGRGSQSAQQCPYWTMRNVRCPLSVTIALGGDL